MKILGVALMFFSIACLFVGIFSKKPEKIERYSIHHFADNVFSNKFDINLYYSGLQNSFKIDSDRQIFLTCYKLIFKRYHENHSEYYYIIKGDILNKKAFKKWMKIK